MCVAIYGYCAAAAAFLVFALVCDGECPDFTVDDLGLLLLISIFWPWALLKSPHPWADASTALLFFPVVFVPAVPLGTIVVGLALLVRMGLRR